MQILKRNARQGSHVAFSFTTSLRAACRNSTILNSAISGNPGHTDQPGASPVLRVFHREVEEEVGVARLHLQTLSLIDSATLIL